jgi:hypothetical protein
MCCASVAASRLARSDQLLQSIRFTQICRVLQRFIRLRVGRDVSTLYGKRHEHMTLPDGSVAATWRNQPQQTEEFIMSHTMRVALATVAGITVASAFGYAPVSAQVAGSTLRAAEYAEMRDVTTGWSARRQLLGQAVYNEKNEKIGSVDDLIVSPEKAVSYAIVGVGGFLGVAKHDVAIPVSQFAAKDGRIQLAGASKDALKAMPEFDYAPQ